MASIISFSLKQSDGTYLKLTASINDVMNQYEQNVVVYETQTIEQRENKEQKKYLGNGKCVWTNGITKTINDIKNEKNNEELQTMLKSI